MAMRSVIGSNNWFKLLGKNDDLAVSRALELGAETDRLIYQFKTSANNNAFIRAVQELQIPQSGIADDEMQTIGSEIIAEKHPQQYDELVTAMVDGWDYKATLTDALEFFLRERVPAKAGPFTGAVKSFTEVIGDKA